MIKLQITAALLTACHLCIGSSEVSAENLTEGTVLLTFRMSTHNLRLVNFAELCTQSNMQTASPCNSHTVGLLLLYVMLCFYSDDFMSESLFYSTSTQSSHWLKAVAGTINRKIFKKGTGVA